MKKYIFVTGGVTSSLGKGIISSSLGLLLKAVGYKDTIQKFDPYLNIDPGTMSPYEHGECYVTKDGAETDLDLGHYERFLGVSTSQDNNVTTGRIYNNVISKERKGEFLGKTVQVIPHITDEIKNSFYKIGKKNEYDIIITEIGGCIGDIESLPFFEAVRQAKLDLKKENFLNIHLTLIPYLSTSGELKTKPTQHSVKKMLEAGIQPDILVCRSEHKLSKEKKDVEFFENNDNCPTCTQPIDLRFKQTQVYEGKKKISELEEGLTQLSAEMGKTQEQIQQYKAVEKKLNDLDIAVAKINTSISEINRHSNRLDVEIQKLENTDNNSNEIQKELEQIKEDLKIVNVEKNKAVEEKKYIDIAREILNDTGVKANIIKKYIPIINNLINRHLQALDFFVNFELDEEFNETIRSRFRDTFNYNSFSEGEKLRIDLALLFTWRTIAKMKNSTNTNLLILDELFDSSLDMQGTDDFFKILKTLQNENTFIISHKGDIMFDKFTNIIKMEKEHNFTRLT